jgi:ATP-dependent exoDNAse (exonuclease V) alpha subunit
MAIYRLEAKIVTRGSGHSAVAAAAYRTGTKIRDERTEKIHDYSSRTKGIIESVILRPENAPTWTAQTASLWNEVERSERRKDSQLAREFILAVPRELDDRQQFELAVGWAQRELVSKGMVAEVSLHHPKNRKNPHVHILCTMRTIDGEKFSAKKPREWNDKALLVVQRESWCKAENDALELAGHPERVDHRSLKSQGIDRKPEPKIGKEAMGMQKRGVLEDTDKAAEVRKVRLQNEAVPFMRAIERRGQVQHYGMAAKWWDKTIFMVSRLRDKAAKVVKKTWQKLLESRREKDPEITR